MAQAVDPSAPTAPTTPTSATVACDWGSNACDTFVYPNLEAVNTYNITYEGTLPAGLTPQLHDNDKAIISYPNIAGQPLNPVQQLNLPNGECDYIVNNSQNDYFVPLNKEIEWTSFKDAVNANPSLGLSILACDAPPQGDVQALCGAADGQVSDIAPTGTALCNAGTPSAISTASGNCSWTWTCVGSNGQTTAACQAPKQSVTSTTSVTGPVNLVVILDASQSMNEMDSLVSQNIKQALPSFAASHPALAINVATIVIGGSGYVPMSQDRCHFGEVYSGTAANGAASSFGFSSVQANSFTPLTDAINYGGQILGAMPKTASTTSAMLVLSDGAETCGGNFPAAVRAQEANGTKMLAVAYPDVSYNPQNFAAFNSFETASSSTDILNALNNVFNIVTTGICTSSIASNQ